MEFRLAKLEELEQVVDVLNNVTLDLLNKGIKQWSYPWQPIDIEGEIKNHLCYLIVVNKRIIGTFFLSNRGKLGSLTLEPNSKYLGKIAILPEFQGQNVGSKVILFAQSLTSKNDSLFYLDCWAGNEKLKQVYFKNGLNYLGDFPEDDYFISVFKSS